MLAFLTRLRGYAWAICAALIGALLFALKLLADSRERWKEAAEDAQFQAKQRKAVDDNLSEVDQTFSRRATLRQKEKQDEPDKVPDRLRNNNDF